MCADCNLGVYPGRFDVFPFLCDECYANRERWAAEQEAKIEKRMAKADLPIVIPKKDVA